MIPLALGLIGKVAAAAVLPRVVTAVCDLVRGAENHRDSVRERCTDETSNRNNPVNAVDPDGLMPDSPSATLIQALSTGNLEAALAIVETNVQLYGTAAAGPIGAALLRYQSLIQQAQQQMASGRFSGNCVQTAQSLFDAFRAAGLNPTFVQLTHRGAGYIHTVSTAYRAPVSQNGYHYAVQMGGRVYDAFTGMGGVLMRDYPRLFMTPAGQMTQQNLQNIGTRLP